MVLFQKKKLLYSNNFIFIDVGNTFTKIFYLNPSYLIEKIYRKINKLEKRSNNNDLINNKNNYLYHIIIYKIINLLNFEGNVKNKHQSLFLRILNDDIKNNKIEQSILDKIIKKINCKKINIYFLDVNKEIFTKLKNFLDVNIFSINSIECNYIPLSHNNLENKIDFSYSPLNSYGIDRVASILYYYYVTKYFFNIEFNYSLILNSGTAMVVDEIEERKFVNSSISLSVFSEIKALNILTSRLPDLQENLNLSYEKIFEIFINFNLKRIIKIFERENIENENLILEFDKINNLSFFEFLNFFNKEIVLSEDEFFNIFNYSISNKNTINSIIYGTLNGFLFKILSLLLLRLKKNFDKKIFIFSGKIFNIKTFFVILLGLINSDFSFFHKKKFLLVSFNDNIFIILKIKIVKNNFNYKIYIKQIFKNKIISKKNTINKKIIKNLEKIKSDKDIQIFLLDSDISLKGLIFENIFTLFFQN